MDGEWSGELAEWYRKGAWAARNHLRFCPPDLNPANGVLRYSDAELDAAGTAYRRGFLEEHERQAHAILDWLHSYRRRDD